MSHGSVEDLRHARRIVLHGVTGSGKSTAALRLGEALGIPVHLVDEEIGFLPAAESPWTNRSPDEMRAIAAGLSAEEAWILDSTYSHFRDVVMARAEIVIGLDYSRWLSLGRLVRRCIVRIIDGTPICNGNRETVGNLVSKDSILWWHLTSFARKRATMRALHDDPAALPTILLARPRDLDRLVAATRTP